MKFKFWPGFAAVLLLFACAHMATAADFLLCVNATSDSILNTSPASCTGSDERKVRIDVLDDGKVLRPTPNSHGLVEKAIIVVHAAGENDVFEKIKAGITNILPAPTEKDKSWLVALRFSKVSGTNNLLWWKNEGSGESGYAMGNPSETTDDVEISPFSVLDYVVRRMKQSWAPNIKEFVIVGFGQNAEFVNRYSIGTSIEGHDALTNPASPASVRYLMVSAGRYTYLNGTSGTQDVRFRYQYVTPGFVDYEDGTQKWKRETTPTSRTTRTCTPHYDSYPYGFTSTPPNHYMKANRENNRKRVTGKQRLFLVGQDDVQGDLDAYLSLAYRCRAEAPP